MWLCYSKIYFWCRLHEWKRTFIISRQPCCFPNAGQDEQPRSEEGELSAVPRQWGPPGPVGLLQRDSDHHDSVGEAQGGWETDTIGEQNFVKEGSLSEMKNVNWMILYSKKLAQSVAIWCSQWNSGFSSGTTDILYPKMDVDPGSSSELNNRIRCRCSSHGLGSVLDGVESSWG